VQVVTGAGQTGVQKDAWELSSEEPGRAGLEDGGLQF